MNSLNVVISKRIFISILGEYIFFLVRSTNQNEKDSAESRLLSNNLIAVMIDSLHTIPITKLGNVNLN